MKPFSKAVVAALKLIYKEIENHNFKTQYHAGVKTFWPVQSNESVIDIINKLNARNKAISVSTFEFFTLYTNIPHHKLKPLMRDFFNFCFQEGDLKLLESQNIGLFGLLAEKSINCLLRKHL